MAVGYWMLLTKSWLIKDEGRPHLCHNISFECNELKRYERPEVLCHQLISDLGHLHGILFDLLLENCKKEIVPDPIPVLHFQNASLNCEVGSACTNSAASSIPNGGLISYSVDKLATINASTGAVTPTEAGAAVVTATQAASDSLAGRFVFTV